MLAELVGSIDRDGFRMMPRPHLDQRLSPTATGLLASVERAVGYPEAVPFLDDSAVIIDSLGSRLRSGGAERSVVAF